MGSTSNEKAARRETIDVAELAMRLGMGQRQIYEAAARDALPVPVIRVGERMVFAKAAVDRLLGVSPDAAAVDVHT